ncbi:MAG: hypothetical protein QM779_10275 [Propionicimonas sp.]|uniref:hypothetical protein n=1 Tax=Propionicimonas sp. TaxID=1955623 RepID=UPI003D14698F
MQRRAVAAAVAGSLALVATLSGCVVVNLGGARSPSASATAVATSATPSDSPTPTPSDTTTSAPTVLGPKGYGALKLRMTKAKARATGLATGIMGTKGSCGASKDGRLVGAEPKDTYDLAGKLFFSENTGKLVIIGAMPGLATPEGIQLGSSTADVKAAYPKWNGDKKDMNGVGYVLAPGSSTSYYRIAVLDGGVTELTLQDIDQDCAE